MLKGVLEKLETMEEMRVWEEQQGQLQDWIAWEHVLEPRRNAEECTARLRGRWQEAMDSVSPFRALLSDMIRQVYMYLCWMRCRLKSYLRTRIPCADPEAANTGCRPS